MFQELISYNYIKRGLYIFLYYSIGSSVIEIDLINYSQNQKEKN